MSMYLESKNAEINYSALFEYYKQADPSVALSQGLGIALVLGGVWIGSCLLSATFAADQAIRARKPDSEVDVVELIRIASQYLAPWFYAACGLGLLGVILPPPSVGHLLLFMLITIGFELVHHGRRNLMR